MPGISIADVVQYLHTDITKIIRELNVGLNRFTFTDNFEAFEVEVTVPATSELEIRNRLRSQEIPTKWIIVKRDGNTLVDGDSEWTKEFVYLKNTGGSDVTATVIFFR